jgi:hypothetical protein
MVGWLEDLFPRLRVASYQIIGPRDAAYNCLAWAAGATDAWWWPSGDPAQVYWPSGVPREETLEAVRAAFATLGYAACDNEVVEAGYEKVAFFTDAARIPTHAARQSVSGRWTSKLGQLELIEHDLRDLEGEAYGTVALVMKRPLTVATRILI